MSLWCFVRHIEVRFIRRTRAQRDPGGGSKYYATGALGAYDQVAHLAIDVGIARAALEDGVMFIRDRARLWFEADIDRVADEPHVLRRVGELTTRLHALKALVDRARATLDSTASAPALNDENTAAASLAVAEAKAFAQEVALQIASPDDAMTLSRAITAHQPNQPSTKGAYPRAAGPASG